MPLLPLPERLCNWKNLAKVNLWSQMRNVPVTKGSMFCREQTPEKNFTLREVSDHPREADSNAAERS